MKIEPHLRGIEKNLSESKQAVVKHIAIARKLEKQRIQYVNAKDAIKSIIFPPRRDEQAIFSRFADFYCDDLDLQTRKLKLQSMLHGDELGPQKHSNLLGQLLFVSYSLAPGTMLYSLPDEHTCQQIAQSLYEIFQCYDDSIFSSHLLSLTVSDIPPNEVLNVFQRIAISASEGSCSTAEATLIFQKSQSCMSFDAHLPRLWHQLCSRLRKKLLLTKLARMFVGELKIRSSFSSSASINVMHQSKRIPAVVRSPNPRKGKEDTTSVLQQLHKELNLSKSKQTALDVHIASNLSFLCQQHLLDQDKEKVGLQNGRKHAAAFQFARSVGLKTIQRHQARLDLLLVAKALRRWEKVVRLQFAHSICVPFMRLLAAKRLFCATLFREAQRLRRALDRWILASHHERDGEERAAVAELQRVGRGWLCRALLKRRAKEEAAITIQRVARGCAARELIHETLLSSAGFAAGGTSSRGRPQSRSRSPSLAGFDRLLSPTRTRSGRLSAGSTGSGGRGGSSRQLQRRLVRAAVQIQRVVRGRLGRLLALRRKEQRAARLLRKKMRAEQLLALRVAAAQTLQRVWRGLRARR